MHWLAQASRELDLGLIRRQGSREGRCWGWDAAGVASEFASKELDAEWLKYGF